MVSPATITPDLIDRLGGERVPRYTSYPTAPHFTAAVGPAATGRWLGEVEAGEAVSAYLHVPFCAELCLYCGCHTRVVRRYAPVEAYVAALVREIDLVAERVAGRPVLRHLHWGGGTPTMLRGSDMRRLMARLREVFTVAPDIEIAVEIDPRTLTPADVETLAAIGVTRASLGVQSLDPQVQRAIRREQSVAETARAVDWLRFSGIEAVNVDLMIGLPHQSVANVVATVDHVLALGPDRVAVFGYGHVPWMKPHQRALPETALPGPHERHAQFEAAAARLVRAGYVRIGLDHFAAPDDSLARAAATGALRRNFQGYTTDGTRTLLGFGASAISSLPGGYAQSIADIAAYAEAVARGELPTARGLALTPEDRLRRDVIERLMCDLAVDLDEVCGRHGVSAEAAFAPELARLDAMARLGVVARSGHRIAVPEAMRGLLRSASAVFDARLATGPGRHSTSL
ncbi:MULTISPECIES: oxygen-independent coproporphyrinogen III oxidase [Methylobacterium]|jgi:oxygen-independent coproporphyrinogen-3 oxidase|uniref:oxygen-independent coproporphyrinogen III oxidase n=1 Tax=Methylobacterium TaxID=407 RepID=UPI0008E1BE2D|nr:MULTISPECIES: oxygen-independent coproporphyrinogen III oxidase [Methylobacterium]MBZ6413928.1 oxygen-independent coproporphyrinogen III oxidase [Methylobacterium sp.]MBK3400911.1 oxygen-independent coproporphyrinogen III oxidase [Methylobacterium ajmalii]MBK3410709.1 oxygen-independent coproporphyrinogen III oxidase [Methylobacterium ajmalii]MBK3421198.1 oxygen-independent coproporphyrinogen III oxidase [Methylobacterium ajmalii]SFF57488.1 oxygen-independent coproporphyrinogen-3 oxidase [M